MKKYAFGIFLSILLLCVVISYGDTASAQYPKIIPKIAPTITIKEIHTIALDKTSYLTSETKVPLLVEVSLAG